MDLAFYGHGALCLGESEPKSKGLTRELMQIFLPVLAALKELTCLFMFSSQLAVR